MTDKPTDAAMIAWLDNCWSIKDTPQAKAIRGRLASLTPLKEECMTVGGICRSPSNCDFPNCQENSTVSRTPTNAQETLNGQPTAKREASLNEFTTAQMPNDAEALVLNIINACEGINAAEINVFKAHTVARSALTAAEQRGKADVVPSERLAPVQGYTPGIPWSMHLRAYDVYCKKFRSQPALIEGGCRGGFGVGELDMFIPGWREELSELHQLRKEVAAARAEGERIGFEKAMMEAKKS